jgi:hypothetical protein
MDYPAILYVKREIDGEDVFLLCDEDPREHAELDEEIEIAEYQLVRKMTIANTTALKQ